MLIRYVLPSMFSMFIAGIYTIVDGLFVGWGTGSHGMAALNVAYPLALLLVAIGELIGIGGGICISHARGRRALRTAEALLNMILYLTVPIAVTLPMLLLPWLPSILKGIGTAPELLQDACSYGTILIVFGGFQIIGIAFLEAMRNSNAPQKAMLILIGGLLANVVLDYLFVIVWQQGVAGSAWATVLSQAFCMIAALTHFLRSGASIRLRRNGWKLFRKQLLGRIFAAGIPSFGIQLSIGIVIGLYNMQTLRYGGVDAVAAYAVVSYWETSIFLFIQGIALGVQPVVSYLHGAGKFHRQRRIALYGMWLAVLAGICGTAGSLAGTEYIGKVFNAHDSVLTFTVVALWIIAPTYPMAGVQKITEAYFQSTERAGEASLLIYLDSCVILPSCLFLLPLGFGLNGVWAALPISKLVVLLIAFYLWHKRGSLEMENQKIVLSPELELRNRMQRLFDLWGKFDKIYFKLLQKRNLSYNSYLVLEELLANAEDGIEPAVLADKLNIPRQTMTFVLDHLEKDGLINRLPHPVDRRKKLIRLSSHGLVFARGVADDVLERECRAMSALSNEEQQTLLEIYAKLSAAFEKSFNTPPQAAE